MSETQNLTQELSEVAFDLDESIQAGVDLQVRKIENRQRQIEAKIELPYSADQVWQVLTDYESLPDFIPNLETSQRLDHPQGGVRIEQVGCQSALMMKFSARVVLDMEENFPKALSFDMVAVGFYRVSKERDSLSSRRSDSCRSVVEGFGRQRSSAPWL